jgi:hypothetical protein
MFFDLTNLVNQFALEVAMLVFLFMLVGVVRGLASQRWGTFVSSFVFGLCCIIVGNFTRFEAMGNAVWNLIKGAGMS